MATHDFGASLAERFGSDAILWNVGLVCLIVAAVVYIWLLCHHRCSDCGQMKLRRQHRNILEESDDGSLKMLPVTDHYCYSGRHRDNPHLVRITTGKWRIVNE